MNVVVIGAGRMGRRHMQVVAQAGHALKAIVDSSPDSLALAAAEGAAGKAVMSTDARAAIRDARADCVVIATTAPSHADLTCLAAELGAKFVLCEKPMATSLADCDRMLEACASSGTALAINHQMRFMAQYTTPKALLESERFGGVRSITVVAGNFGMSMNGTHYLEMFRYMTGEPCAEVSAWFSDDAVPNPRGAQFQDRAGTIRAENASGRRFILEASSDQGHGVTVVYGAQYGQIVVDELGGMLRLVARQDEHRALPTTRYGMPATEEVRKIAPADVLAPTLAVLDALISGADYPTGEEGRAAVAALVAAYVSNENGHAPIPVDSARLPLDRTFAWA